LTGLSARFELREGAVQIAPDPLDKADCTSANSGDSLTRRPDSKNGCSKVQSETNERFQLIDVQE
jgi:hypothetical protein